MIRAWLKAWRERQDTADYERGYAWVIVECNLNHADRLELERSIDTGAEFDMSAFDRGAYQALVQLAERDRLVRAIRRLELKLTEKGVKP